MCGIITFFIHFSPLVINYPPQIVSFSPTLLRRNADIGWWFFFLVKSDTLINFYQDAGLAPGYLRYGISTGYHAGDYTFGEIAGARIEDPDGAEFPAGV